MKIYIASKAKSLVASILYLLTIMVPLVTFAPQSSGATTTITWDGGGSDNLWSTALNWDSDSVPVDGDVVELDLSILTQNETLTNDLTGLTLGGINVTNSSPSYYTYTIDGNDFSVSGDISVNSFQLLLDISTLTVSANNLSFGSISSTGSLAIGSNNISFENGKFNFDGALSGSGQVTLLTPTSGGGLGGCDYGNATATYPFKGDNSGFSGPIVIESNASLLISDVSTILGKHASSITVQSGGNLTFLLNNNTDMTYSTNINIAGGSIFTNQLPADDNCNTPTTLKTVTLSGNITATSAVDVYMYNRASLKMTGTVAGSSYFSVVDGYGTGDEVLTIGSSTQQSAEKTTTYTDDQSGFDSNVSGNNVLIVKEGAKAGNVYVNGGTLKGKGITKIIYLGSGTVAPGESPGCLTSTGLSYTGGTVDIELGGTTECTGYDQQVVNGSVALGTATTLAVSMYNSFAPKLNDSFTIIKNDASDAVTGTFTGLAEGATFKVDGYTLGITYKGGDGNDVVLTVQAVPATATAPDTGLGSLMTNTVASTVAAISVALMLFGFRKFNAKKQ
ncbi:hypothetical protein KC960_01195 [Candidatus Saccharibacteria bacterium]|nr:hypothetical protein [Candidatus Saccharibacteria bacterium]